MHILRLRSVPALVLAGLCLVCAGDVRSQSVVPSADQLELLRTLTPEQRETIQRQLEGRSSSSSSQDTASRNDDTSSSATRNPATDRAAGAQALQRRAEQEEEEEGKLNREGKPILMGDDTIVVEIEFQRDSEFLPLLDGTLPPNAAANGQLPPVNPAAATQNGQTTGDAQSRAPRSPELDAEGEPLEPPTAEERKKLTNLLHLIRAKNPYQLSRDGVLFLPGFPGIPLAGLTDVQASLRLEIEPSLSRFDLRVTRLPLRKTGSAALKPFGYDLFERAPSSFAPVTNVPVPADYVLGPGDELAVQLYGNQNRVLRLTVSRDGRVNFPQIGPISVSGQRFSEVKSSLEAQVEQQMIGVRASVSMGEVRSIRVFVLGEARIPGSYTISGLGTITSALFAAGGVKTIGSLRNIELKRQGALVQRFDLYDLLLRGDNSDDEKLLPGDVIFIPPVGATVGVTGEVRRPAIYESRQGDSVADIIKLAGGLTPEADSSKATMTRIDAGARRIVLQINPASARDGAQLLANGDLLRIARLPPTLHEGVTVSGHLYAPGAVAWREGLRLSEAIPSVDDLQPDADIHYVLIRRELPPDRRIAVVSADLAAALRAPGSEADVVLMPRDRITVFDLASGRDRVIRPLIEELRLQGEASRPSELVRIDGRVKVPGEYPLEPHMTVSDLIRAGGSLTDEAYGGKAELTRYEIVNGDSRQTRLISVDLAAVFRGDASANIVLQPFDSLSIKEVPEWGVQEDVVLMGEVRFPGRYAIKRGETMKSVLARAGGLTEYAFAEGSVFTREELREREQKQLDVLASRLQNDLATLALQGVAANQAQAGSALIIGQSLLSQVRSAKSVGRLVIDLPLMLRLPPGSSADVVLHGGDQLIVPRYQQEVTVIGEVQSPTSHFYRPGLSRDDYVKLSGGAARRADKSKIYVVRADGSVVARESNRWFGSSASTRIRPGDTIVLPLDTERLPALPFWQAVTQIVYNLAISAAAVNSF